MAKRTSRRKSRLLDAPAQFVRRAVRMFFGLIFGFFGLVALVMALGIFVNPWTTPYMFSESRRLGDVAYEWVDFERIAPIMARVAVASEDANFCEHWGFDLVAIKQAIAAGGTRGASTISQQTVKNVYLWHGRNYTRKALEALLTPMLELLWSKERIIEVYLNIAEFDEGVFGVRAAADHYFGVQPDQLSEVQAARLAAILPDPKRRSASQPSSFVRERARAALAGAATIGKDGRAACFES